MANSKTKWSNAFTEVNSFSVLSVVRVEELETKQMKSSVDGCAIQIRSQLTNWLFIKYHLFSTFNFLLKCLNNLIRTDNSLYYGWIFAD